VARVRFVAVFLATLALLLGVLYAFGRDAPAPPEISEAERPPPAPPVLLDRDLAHERGASPLPGRLLWLRDLLLKSVRQDFVQLETGFREIVREKDRPRARDFWCRLFERGEDGAPRLVAALESPYLDGDLARLLHAYRDEPLDVSLAGGVAIDDGEGRPMLRVPDRLDLDLRTRTVRTAERVELGYPERKVRLVGTGLEAELRGAGDRAGAAVAAGPVRATLRSDVRAEFELRGAPATLRCLGPLQASESDGVLTVVAEGDVQFDDGSLRVRCARVELYFPDARAARDAGSADVTAATVIASGEVRAECGGEWSLAAARVVLDGDLATLEGPLTLTRRGRFPLFGEGERRIVVEAGRAAVTLLREGGGRIGWEEAFLADGVSARDEVNHDVRVAADQLSLRANRLVAEGRVAAKTVRGELAADRVVAEGDSERTLDLLLEGSKRVRTPVKGTFGGGGGEGTLVFECAGPLRLRSGDSRRIVAAEREVEAWIEEGGVERSRLSCGAVTVTLDGETPERLVAQDDVVLADARRGLVARAASLEHDALAKTTTLRGAPAKLSCPAKVDRFTVEAPVIGYDETARSFSGSGGVRIRAPASRGSWEVDCREIDGVLGEGDAIERAVARGSVDARGPNGRRVRGGTLTYKAGRAEIEGDGCRLDLGEEGGLAAEAFVIELDPKTKEVVAAETRGKGEFTYSPKPAKPGDPAADVRSWRGVLRGPARYAKQRITIPDGAALEALDAEGRVVLDGEARHVEVELEADGDAPRWKRVVGEDGVVVRSRRGTKGPVEVRARRLVSEPLRRHFVLEGHAQVKGGGFAPDARFERVEFILDETHGLSGLRAYGAEIGAAEGN